jgi:uncharacterized protein with HEPN domain
MPPSRHSAFWLPERGAILASVGGGLEIISEASRHIPDDLKELAPDIPWRQIAAIGNLLRHEYQRTKAFSWMTNSNPIPINGNTCRGSEK